MGERYNGAMKNVGEFPKEEHQNSFIYDDKKATQDEEKEIKKEDESPDKKSIKSPEGLSQNEIDQMVRNAERNAERDANEIKDAQDPRNFY